MKNKNISKWIDANQFKILSKIKDLYEINDFFEENPNGIEIVSHFFKNTKKAGEIPKGILKIGNAISFLKTKGKRKLIMEFLSQLDSNDLKVLTLNGNFYSKNKKIFPLMLENIQKSNLDKLIIFNKFDPTIKELKNFKIVSLCNFTIDKESEIKETIKTDLILNNVFFDAKFDFISIFSKPDVSNIRSLKLERVNLPEEVKFEENQLPELNSLEFKNIADSRDKENNILEFFKLSKKIYNLSLINVSFKSNLKFFSNILKMKKDILSLEIH